VSLLINILLERSLKIVFRAYTILITYDKNLTGGQLFVICCRDYFL
jgi:hypothetical protein